MQAEGANAQRFYEMFVDSLRLVAADYESQVMVLPSFVLVPDEIAEIFDSVVRLLDQIERFGLVKKEHVEQTQAIDTFFQEKSGTKNEVFWTLDAMRHDSEWEYIRHAARKLLTSLGEPERLPNLRWITYERGAK